MSQFQRFSVTLFGSRARAEVTRLLCSLKVSADDDWGSLSEHRTLRCPGIARFIWRQFYKMLETKVEKISPSDSEDKATASLNGSLLCSSPSWPLVAIAKWNDDLLKVLGGEACQKAGITRRDASGVKWFGCFMWWHLDGHKCFC